MPPVHPLRILYVTDHQPGAPSYGAQLRVLNLARQLGKLGSISMVLLQREGVATDQPAAGLGAEFSLVHVASTRPAPRRGVLQRVRHELDPLDMNTHGEYVADEDRKAVLALIAQHDVTWVHTVRVANALRIERWPRTVLDIDDLPSGVYRAGAHRRTPLRWLLDRRMAFIWSRREKALSQRFEVLAVCNPGDREHLTGDAAIHLVRNGFTPPALPVTRREVTPPRLGFIGLMRYGPNRQGVEWFLARVWPAVRREMPTARLRIVGQGAEMLGAGDPQVDCLGYLDDTADEMATWSAMIVPISSGGGTRIKIVDAFSKRCPVVSTTFGANGYDLTDGQELLLADQPATFAQACLRLLKDRPLGERLASQAWQRFRHQWTWDAVGLAAAAAVTSCMAAAAGRQVPARALQGPEAVS